MRDKAMPNHLPDRHTSADDELVRERESLGEGGRQSNGWGRVDFAAPYLGTSVEEVMRGFLREAEEWVGLGVVEAFIPITERGTSRRYRLGIGKRVGVVELDGWCLRDATEAEEDELESSIAAGHVQITRRIRGHQAEVILHQATGRALAGGSDNDEWVNGRRKEDAGRS
jgi:hypothetical protein